jgi:hypothetical protein
MFGRRILHVPPQPFDLIEQAAGIAGPFGISDVAVAPQAEGSANIRGVSLPHRGQVVR